MTDHVISSNVRGEDIDRFTQEKLLPVLDGQPLDLVCASVLSIIVFSMVPDLEPHEVAKIVQDTAAYIITAISAVAGDNNAVVN